MVPEIKIYKIKEVLRIERLECLVKVSDRLPLDS